MPKYALHTMKKQLDFIHSINKLKACNKLGRVGICQHTRGLP